MRPGERTLGLIGFGVNLFHEAGELPATATSLRLLGGRRGWADRASLADLTWDLVEGVEAELAHLGDAAYAVESYRPLSIHQPGERIVCRYRRHRSKASSPASTRPGGCCWTATGGGSRWPPER